MMHATESTLPELASLQHALTGIFGAQLNGSRRFTIVDRQRNVYQSTFPCEIISVSFDGQQPVQLFCKYEAGRSEGVGSYRRSIGHEFEVYRQVLMPLGVTVPKLYGGHADSTGRQSWILLQHLESAVRVKKVKSQHAGIVKAAEWIGDFHRRTRDLEMHQRQQSLLDSYDAPYLLRFTPKLLKQERDTIESHPWIKRLIARYEADVSLLCSEPVVIHGEYYPDNVLYSNGGIYPVDWQSAAIGAGEIDLATLTEGNWTLETRQACESAYRSARWPEGAPVDFMTRLALAKVYWMTHVLTERPGWIADETYLNELRSAAQTLGVD